MGRSIGRAVAAFAAAAIAMTAGARPSRSDTARLMLAGGASTRGAVARAEATGRLGRAVAVVRADARAGGASPELVAVAGFAPRAVRRRAVAARWERACLARLAAASSVQTERCWIHGAARAPVDSDAADGWLGAVAGVRRDELGRTAVLAAIRIHPTDDVLGDVIELGATGVVAGRDRLFVQHMRFAPGWYLRAQTRVWRVVIGGEVGTTGLASRTDAGTFRAEVFATATIGVAVGL